MSIAEFVDPQITVGNIIEITLIVVGLGATLIRLNNSVLRLASDMGDVQSEVKKIANLMTAVAVQDARLDSLSERLNTIDRRYDEIRKAARPPQT